MAHYIMTPEIRKKLSESKLGDKNHMFGKKRTEESKQKTSDSLKGHKTSEETRRKIREANIGKHHSKETLKKISDAKKGKPHSKETREKMSIAMSGEKNIYFGKKLSESHRQKMIESHICGFWYGNVKHYDATQYCEKFNFEFKDRVRAFRNNICFECGTPQNGIKLAVHHVHYDKKMCCNGSPHDVVPLCQCCHSKTNYNRDYWEDHFTELIYAYDPEGKCFFTKEEMLAYSRGEVNG